MLGWVVESVQWRKLDSAGMVKIRDCECLRSSLEDWLGMISDADCCDVFLTTVLESSAMDPK